MIAQDPSFREQYAGGVTPDPEVESALAGTNTPRISLPPAVQPMRTEQWMNQNAVKLR